MNPLDVITVGLGPANLSLAALLEPVAGVDAAFLERRDCFRWHEGFMVPDAQLQVSFLKDLVTLVDPSNSLSFLNYLAQHGRLYRFLGAHLPACSRQEFEQYYRWAADQISSVRWGQEVERVELVGGSLRVSCASGRTYTGRNVVLGSGRVPVLPKSAAKLRGNAVMHSGELCVVKPALEGNDILVVGGGQSGAETVNLVLSGEIGLPRSVTWISSRVGFLPLDDSPFTNEWFHPAYVDHFFELSVERRNALLQHQRMASDGVSESLLQSIYRRLYNLDVIHPGRVHHRLLTSHRMVDLQSEYGRLLATLRDENIGSSSVLDADVVICATGYRSTFPEYLEPLRERVLDVDGRWTVQRDYSLAWDGPPGLGIYVQNAADETHGIADRNLSLSSWRSAQIINSICGRTVYAVNAAKSTINWPGRASSITTGPDLPGVLPPVAEMNAR